MRSQVQLTDNVTGAVALFSETCEALFQAAYLISLGHEVKLEKVKEEGGN